MGQASHRNESPGLGVKLLAFGNESPNFYASTSSDRHIGLCPSPSQWGSSPLSIAGFHVVDGGCCGHCLALKYFWQSRFRKHGPSHLHESSIKTIGYSVLLWGVGSCGFQLHPFLLRIAFKSFVFASGFGVEQFHFTFILSLEPNLEILEALQNLILTRHHC